MVLNCLLYPLRFDADVSLGSGGGTVLQESLHQSNIASVGLVDFCSVPFAEAVGADALIA